MVICPEQGAKYLHTVQLMRLVPIISCFNKIQIVLSSFFGAGLPGCPGKEAIKRVSVLTADVCQDSQTANIKHSVYDAQY